MTDQTNYTPPPDDQEEPEREATHRFYALLLQRVIRAMTEPPNRGIWRGGVTGGR